MRRCREWVMFGLTALSVLVFTALAWVELATFPDSDVSVYFASRGQLISADTFVDGSAITVRRFSPFPWSITPRISYCVLEKGSDVRAANIAEPQNRYSLDTNNHLVQRPPYAEAFGGFDEGNRMSPAPNATVLLRVPLLPGLLISAVLPAWHLTRPLRRE